MRSYAGEIDEAVDPAQQVIVGDMPLKAEAIEQRLLHHPSLAHQRPNLPRPGEGNQRLAPQSSEVFQHNPPKADNYKVAHARSFNGIDRIGFVANCSGGPPPKLARGPPT